MNECGNIGGFNRKQWDTVFLLPHKHNIPNRIKELLFTLNSKSYYPTKANIWRVSPTVNDRCTSCEYEGETIELLYVACFHASSFCFDLQKKLEISRIKLTF